MKKLSELQENGNSMLSVIMNRKSTSIKEPEILKKNQILDMKNSKMRRKMHEKALEIGQIRWKRE